MIIIMCDKCIYVECVYFIILEYKNVKIVLTKILYFIILYIPVKISVYCRTIEQLRQFRKDIKHILLIIYREGDGHFSIPW